MCPKIYRVYGCKTESESTNRGRVYLCHELFSEAIGAPHAIPKNI